jgi:acetolactate synthase-1/2/3 large subunit
MKLSGGEIVVRALEDEGIHLTFGIPGTHNIELYDALAASERVRPILVTDEQAASFMADAVWRASGAIGCANLVPGAGLTHALSGIAEAFMDNVPMLVLGCGVRNDTGKAYQLHDIDQLAVVAPVVKARFRPERGQELYTTIRRACQLAREGAPGPVMVEVPANLYLSRHDVDLVPPPVPLENTAALVGQEEVERAAARLRDAKRPLLYLGLGAAPAGSDLVALAERLEAPVATTFQGKGVFPESHPLFLWNGFGAAAPAFVRSVVAGCDATLAIGCRFGEVATASYGLEPPQPLIHADIDPAVPGRNFPAEVAITADSAAFVPALLERLQQRTPDAALRDAIRAGHEAVWHDWLAEVGGERVTPAFLLRELQRRFGPDAIFVTDSGNGTFLAMECLRLERPGHYLAPVDYSCMGYAIPAAVGAKLARPDAPVLALAGDGAFLMTGLELLTAAAHDVAIAVLVLRDGELAQIAQFQSTALSRKTASRLPDYDLAALCDAVGVRHLRLDADGAVPHVLEEAAGVLDGGRTVVVEVAVDYSRKTFFTRGVVKTNLRRLPWADRIRFVGRAVGRKVVATR